MPEEPTSALREASALKIRSRLLPTPTLGLSQVATFEIDSSSPETSESIHLSTKAISSSQRAQSLPMLKIAKPLASTFDPTSLSTTAKIVVQRLNERSDISLAEAQPFSSKTNEMTQLMSENIEKPLGSYDDPIEISDGPVDGTDQVLVRDDSEFNLDAITCQGLQQQKQVHPKSYGKGGSNSHIWHPRRSKRPRWCPQRTGTVSWSTFETDIGNDFIHACQMIQGYWADALRSLDSDTYENLSEGIRVVWRLATMPQGGHNASKLDMVELRNSYNLLYHYVAMQKDEECGLLRDLSESLNVLETLWERAHAILDRLDIPNDEGDETYPTPKRRRQL